MATSPGSVYHGEKRPPPSSRRQRQHNEVHEVIDLSTSSPEPCSTAALFAGANLSNFTIGDRLGATRDGGEGFQVHHYILWASLVCFSLCLLKMTEDTTPPKVPFSLGTSTFQTGIPL